MSFLSNLIKKAAPIVATVAPGTVVGTTAAIASEQYKRQDESYRRKLAEQQAKEREMEVFGTPRSSIGTINANLAATTPTIGSASSGGGFFSTLRSGLRETGGFISDVFSSGIPQLFGVSRPANVGQQPAITTVTNVGAQESQGSGSIQAGMGAFLPSVLGGARSLLKSPLGQLALGSGAVAGASLLGPDGRAMRVTRKMKSQARMVVNLVGGDLSAAANILGVSEDMLIGILLKRFRNDGPVVTKAALRKTKQTVRRLKNMCDMYDSLRPTATRRKTPMRRASTTTLIKN
tara:strand:+ start:921 stop:1793 length:873 start_codon:yes stop_codon:yes gene_type:complete